MTAGKAGSGVEKALNFSEDDGIVQQLNWQNCRAQADSMLWSIEKNIISWARRVTDETDESACPFLGVTWQNPVTLLCAPQYCWLQLFWQNISLLHFLPPLLFFWEQLWTGCIHHIFSRLFYIALFKYHKYHSKSHQKSLKCQNSLTGWNWESLGGYQWAKNTL